MSLCPYGFDAAKDSGGAAGCCDTFPPSILPLLAASGASYEESVTTAILRGNQAFNEFLGSMEGKGFHGEVGLIGDMLGGLLAFDAILRHRDAAAGVSRHPSSASAYSETDTVNDISATIPEDDVCEVSA